MSCDRQCALPREICLQQARDRIALILVKPSVAGTPEFIICETHTTRINLDSKNLRSTARWRIIRRESSDSNYHTRPQRGVDTTDIGVKTWLRLLLERRTALPATDWPPWTLPG
ncbi:MAG: hypothetical protein ABGZ24_03790 [Fuerstiella sp.]